MKKILFALLLAVSSSSFAHGYHYGHRGYGYGGWVAPVLIGGIIGYEMSRPQVVVQQPPVIIQQPPVVVQQPPAPYGYHWITILDATCNCYKQVLTNN